jgi:PKD repeat protein
MNNGSYTMVGMTNSFGFGSWDVLAINIDSLGNINWAKDYGSPFVDEYPVATSTKDGGMIISAITNRNTSGQDAYLIKTDALGNSGCNERDVTDSIIVKNVNTIVTIPVTHVDSGGMQDTVPVSWVIPNSTEQTICTCSVTANFTDIINGTTITFFDLSSNASSWLWNFGQGNNATQQNPVHTYSQGGIYTVCLTATASGGCSEKICKTLSIPTGINELQENIIVRVFPNPTSGLFNFSCSIIPKEIFITDIIGQRIITIPKINAIDISSFPSGVYFLNVKTEKGTFVRKIIKE